MEMAPLSISVAFVLSHCGLIYFVPCLGNRVGVGVVCCNRVLKCMVEEPDLHQQGLLGSQPESGNTRAGPGAFEPQVRRLLQSPLFCSPRPFL